jgi:hypothetical protein
MNHALEFFSSLFFCMCCLTCYIGLLFLSCLLSFLACARGVLYYSTHHFLAYYRSLNIHIKPIDRSLSFYELAKRVFLCSSCLFPLYFFQFLRYRLFFKVISLVPFPSSSSHHFPSFCIHERIPKTLDQYARPSTIILPFIYKTS